MTGKQLNADWALCAAGVMVPVDGPCPICGATKDGHCGEEHGDLKPLMDQTIVHAIPEDDGKTLDDCKPRFDNTVNFRGGHDED